MAKDYKAEFEQYMTDVKGWNSDEIEESWYYNEGYIPNILSSKEIKEMIAYSK